MTCHCDAVSGSVWGSVGGGKFGVADACEEDHGEAFRECDRAQESERGSRVFGGEVRESEGSFEACGAWFPVGFRGVGVRVA